MSNKDYKQLITIIILITIISNIFDEGMTLELNELQS